MNYSHTLYDVEQCEMLAKEWIELAKLAKNPEIKAEYESYSALFAWRASKLLKNGQR